ncbi:MAG: Dihydrofolate reductase [Firmicutes bacterium ADurb.Bin193]|nr:MAG: Dihydrofolate reductase [Firmicutes bacterium ADurb.Bin193]
MNLIVAVDENYGIGIGGRLLASIPEDMKRFREMTLGKSVVMGRATFMSLPGSKPLKDRLNIVMSRDKNLRIEGAVVCHSVEELSRYDKLFVIGGQEIYALLLPYCKTAYITKIYKQFQADRFFPNIEEMENWSLTARSGIKRYDNLEYEFLTFQNKNPRAI